MFGTLDTWILWQLTGGTDDGVHATDVTNASRTMLMNLETLDWDNHLCTFFKIPKFILPKIRSCAEIYGYVYDGPLKGIPIAAVSVCYLTVDVDIRSLHDNHSKHVFQLISVWANSRDRCWRKCVCTRSKQRAHTMKVAVYW